MKWGRGVGDDIITWLRALRVGVGCAVMRWWQWLIRIVLITSLLVVAGFFGVGSPMVRATTYVCTTAPGYVHKGVSGGITSFEFDTPGDWPGPSSTVGMSVVTFTINGIAAQAGSGSFQRYSATVGKVFGQWTSDPCVSSTTLAVVINMSQGAVDGGYSWSWSGSLIVPAGPYVGAVSEVTALAVSIGGPGSVELVEGGVWTATATGGTSPYSYAWDYGATGPFFAYDVGTGSTFSHVFPAGTWALSVRVTDSVGAVAYAGFTVVAASVAGSYRAEFVRSGAYGQYLVVRVYDAGGLAVTINSTASTQFGIYGSSGGFGWVNADNEATWYQALSWRWTMSANFDGTTSPPPADFWLKTTINIAGGVALDVTHHFSSIAEIWTGWYGPTGNQLVPETPPAPTSNLPDWLQALINALYVLLAPILFVFMLIKFLVEALAAAFGYATEVIALVLSLSRVVIAWAGVALTQIFNFTTAAPGGYVSLASLWALAGLGSSLAPAGSVFHTLTWSVTNVDTVLAYLHDTFITGAAWQWLWWGVFVVGLMARVIHARSGGGDDDA